MKMPAPYWTVNYQVDRRNHHHRCQCCNRNIADGETVLMHRFAKGTKALHVSCADRKTINGFTWRELFEAHGMAYLAYSGWPDAKAWMETAPIAQPGAVA